MAIGHDDLVRSSFDAFLRGDWDTLAQVMDPGKASSSATWCSHESTASSPDRFKAM